MESFLIYIVPNRDSESLDIFTQSLNCTVSEKHYIIYCCFKSS